MNKYQICKTNKWPKIKQMKKLQKIEQCNFEYVL